MSCGRDRIITNYDMSGIGRLFGTSICTGTSRGKESVWWLIKTVTMEMDIADLVRVARALVREREKNNQSFGSAQVHLCP